jgi:3-deoxy-7-phosphoheptulonate synthase
MSTALDDVRVIGLDPLPEPERVRASLPPTDRSVEVVLRCRRELHDVLEGRDRRLVVIVGPCSIHDPEAAMEYATHLAQLRERVADRLLVLMRVYFEKPRTTVGWKGLINDPNLDGTHDIHLGLRKARDVLLRINELGLPCATEFLDPVVPQYTADLVSWAAIGARTTESQTHRELASGLSMPVGFKNSTEGGLQVALDAMVSSRSSHHFLGVGLQGRVCVVHTSGNPDVHLVLRGGRQETNFSRADVAYARAKLAEIGVGGRSILVDCSHGNSNKDYLRQAPVFRSLLEQYGADRRSLMGMMLESHLVAGNQKLGAGRPLTYGQSITDACIDWQTTEQLIEESYTQASR